MSRDWSANGASSTEPQDAHDDTARDKAGSAADTPHTTGDSQGSPLPPPPSDSARTKERRSLKNTSDDAAPSSAKPAGAKGTLPPAIPPLRSATLSSGKANEGAPGASAASAARAGSSASARKGRSRAMSRPGGQRQARLMLYSVNPWSVMKLAFLLSIALGIIGLIATILLWSLLDGMHVFAKMEDLLKTLGSEQLLSLMDFVRLPRVMSLATLIGVINIVLLTALSTIGAFLYNITSALVGGIHVTFTDD